MINSIIQEIQGCEGYIDDVIIYSKGWTEHLERIKEIFEKLLKANLTINLLKSEFRKATVTYLGYEVGQGKVKPVTAKIDTIEFPVPKTEKELVRFLRMAGYYRKFCRNFSDVVSCLTNLLCKNVKFLWTDDYQESFTRVKLLVQNSPILISPNYEKPFKLIIDASDIGAVAVVVQEDAKGIDHPVCYYSKNKIILKSFLNIRKITLLLKRKLYLCYWH